MALLTDLPNELLHEIMVIASDDGFHHKRLKKFALVNKQLRTVAFPLLVRLWNNYYGKPKLGLLALHLLRYPQHRSQLRTLIFQNYYADKGSQSPSGYRATFYQTLPHRPEILNELAEEAKRTLPDLAESSEGWIDRIRQGQVGAILALILAWATSLTTVYLYFRGIYESADKDLVGRCLSRQTRVRFVSCCIGYFLPLPRNMESFAPDTFVSILPGSLETCHLDWLMRHVISQHLEARPDSRYNKGQAHSCIMKAIYVLLQEAGPGRKFSKLRNIDFSLLGINVWSRPTLDKAVEELNKVVELAKSRGVELDYYDYTDKEYRTTAVRVSTCDT
ncbi:hypothetical protein FPOA_11625 [Fusarium poae]|uniref:F-box domain-containing protein n=1 Tax=Fusarium poae TaxID=36050 RepID=A0A1B8AHI4_FUSPO|nr:hypothetical protein FPOA_11625 [Fusarium poae]